MTFSRRYRVRLHLTARPELQTSVIFSLVCVWYVHLLRVAYITSDEGTPSTAT